MASRHSVGIVPLLCLLEMGCGGRGDGDSGSTTVGDGSTTVTADGASDDGATSSGDGETDSGEDGQTGTSDDGGTGSTDDPGGTSDPPSRYCEDRELPPRDGETIVVAPGAAGMVVHGGSETTLRAVVSSANPGDTVLLEDGTYTFPEAGSGEYTGVILDSPEVTLRSMRGDADGVILDSAYVDHGSEGAPITIDASGVVVADLTVKRSIFHLVHLWADADDVTLHNLRLMDGGQQFLKASPGDGTSDGVEVSCSRFVMTADGRDNVWGYGPQDGNTTCYTGGIDTHDARAWTVHHNEFEGIYCDATGVQRPAHGKYPEVRNDMTYTGGLAEHAIHMWNSAQGHGHTIDSNRVTDCARGIGIGLSDPVYDSMVINNMVFSQHAGSSEHDVGIIVERAVDTLVAHNTVYFSDPDSYPSAIEYRWDTTTNSTLHGNLTNRAIKARDGATATESDNVTDADSGWFVDAATGDLHLSDCTAPGSAAQHASVPHDYDDDARSDPTTPGADACMP